MAQVQAGCAGPGALCAVMLWGHVGVGLWLWSPEGC